MANETTTYGTPAAETPFSTPISTPRRVPYRVNPVKLVRQHVPVKVQSCPEIASPAPAANADSANSRHPVNPMQKKRVKCTVQACSEFHDGVGDQIESLSDDSRRSTPHNVPSQQPTSSDLRNKSINKVPNEAEVNSKLINSLQERIAACHSAGDAVPAEGEVENMNNSNLLDAKSVENISNSAKPIDAADDSPVEQAVATMKKKIRLIDELVSENSSLHKNCHNVAVNSIQDNKVIADKPNTEAGKLSNADKPRKVPQPKKSSCVPDSQHDIATSHKCDKKKFYDPRDIRKYMVKKKTERLAKEREEKNKKANEMAALKRKTEVTKMFTNRNRFAYYQYADTTKEIPEKKKFSKKPAKCSHPAEESHSQPMHIAKTKQAYHDATINKPSISSSKDRGAVAKRTSRVEARNTKIENKDSSSVREPKFSNICDFKGIDETEKYFKEKFNDIITKCVEEASKIVNAELCSPAADSLKTQSGSKPHQNSSSKRAQVVENAASAELLTGLDVINIQNPYFSSALKDKPDFTDDVDLSVQHFQRNYSSTSSKERKTPIRDKRRVDVERKRPKLEGVAPTLNEFLDNFGNLALTRLKSELTLSDLNYSNQKRNEVGSALGEENSDKTYIVGDTEVRRKSARMAKNTESKENLNTSLEVSGVKPLSFKPFVSTPLMEKNVMNNAERFLWSQHSATEPKPNTKVRISLDRVFSSEVKSELPKKGGFERHNVDTKNLMKVSSLESLTIQNSSVLLPKSNQVIDDEECIVKMDTSAVTLSEDPALIFAESTTLPVIDLEKAIEFDVNRESRNNILSMGPSEDQLQISSSRLLDDLYDQMIKNEDEKLLQILRKIHQQKEALNKYLRSEVFALELQKSQYRENKDEEKVKTIKKKQRGILLKVTKNIIELDKMKKSIVETVEKRKTELLKQKSAMKEKKMIPKQKMSNSKQKKKPDISTRTILVSKQMNTLFGISSSTCTSVILENDDVLDENVVDRNEYLIVNEDFNKTVTQETISGNATGDKNVEVKDTATSPVHFNAGISIRLDLDPEKLVQLKHSFAKIKINSTKNGGDDGLTSADMLQNTAMVQKNESNAGVSEEAERPETRDNKAIKIKRPLSPVILPPSKKFQLRRLSSSSEMTLTSLNDTTTTDQSDVELRISALQEQLRQRKLEAERLRKEEKQLRKEKLRSKEQSLLKQLEAYDEYIQRVSKILAENSNFTEIAKPQIKPHPTCRRQYNEKLHDRKGDVDSVPTTSDYIEDAAKKHNDDLETNTEDSEKQMRKADSGILIESEITEPSENVDLKPKSEHAKTEKNENENVSSLGSEVQTQSASASDRGRRRTESAKDVATSSNILQTINDLQSEVNSLSEQLYSLDFDEEIPEELPDTKSDISEINENNTSMSIEELLSDRHSDGSDGMRSSGAEERKLKQISEEIVENAVQQTNVEETIVSKESGTGEDEIDEPPVMESDKPDTDAENILNITSVESQIQTENDELVVSREIQVVEANDEPLQDHVFDAKANVHEKSHHTGINATSLQNRVPDTETEDSEIHEEIHNIESLSDNVYEDSAASRKESAESYATPDDLASDESDKTIQEEDMLPEGPAPSIKSGTSTDSEFGLFNVKNVSEIESSELDVDEKHSLEDEIPNRDSILEDVESISSLEQISQDLESASKLMAGSDENETRTSHELIKIDYLNESEGSDVPEVDNGVLPLEEVKTVMDEMKFSTSDASAVVVSKSAVDVRRNYNNVLVNLKSYFDSKTKDDLADERITSEKIEDLPTQPDFVVTPMKVVHFALDSLEETDVSESLEYDAVPVAISEETIPKHPVTDLDDNAKSAQFSDVQKIEPGFKCGTEDAAKASHHEEISREKDRSVEEIVEDHSIPNLLGETFVVNEETVSDGNVTEEYADSATPTLEEQISENLESNMADEDLEQITEDQTPFLQALKRDTDNLIARRKDSLDKMASDLFETLIEDTSISKSQITNDYEAEMIPVAEETVEISKSEEVDELNELDDSFRTTKSLTEFDDKWLEKRVDFDESRLREAEELRLQQLKIEQEIEELQAQQHIPPYIYLREIPNKPPPPYTPPTDVSAKIPTNETELREFVGSTIEYVCDAIEKGTDVDNINQLPEYTQGKKKNREVVTYKRFLFDLTKEIARNILEESKTTTSLPWEEISRQKVPKPRPNKEELQKRIDNEIRVLFGFESKINKEKLIIQWSRKRRTDFVDDLLIQELQEEENEWTNYEEDELIIKNKITENLLDDLIDDTVISLQNAIRKKEAKG